MMTIVPVEVTKITISQVAKFSMMYTMDLVYIVNILFSSSSVGPPMLSSLRERSQWLKFKQQTQHSPLMVPR